MNMARAGRGMASALLLLLSVGGLSICQPLVAKSYGKMESESGVYAIPQPEHLVVFSLGYRAALADLLYGRTLVEAGIHFVEKRVFEHLGAYLWAIIALDPQFRDLYHYADTMLTLSTVEMPRENYRIARDILERGLKEFPNDAEMWMSAGMFVALVAPPRLPENEDVDEWKAAGARMMQHACSLYPNDVPLPPACMTSARLFERAGKTEAAISSMERLLNIAEDEETRASAMTYLTQLLGQREARRREEAARELQNLNWSDMPGIDRSRYQLLSPPFDPSSCVGVRIPFERRECMSSFAHMRAETPTEP